MICVLLILLPVIVYGCDLGPCTCNIQFNTMECPPGRNEDPSSCGAGFILAHRKCDLASVVRPKLHPRPESAEVFESPMPKYEPIYPNSPAKTPPDLPNADAKTPLDIPNYPAKPLQDIPNSPSQNPLPYPEPTLERGENFPTDWRSIARALWKLVQDSGFEEPNMILGSITLAISLLNSIFAALLYRQHRFRPPPPVGFSDRYRLDSDRESVTSGDEIPADGSTQPDAAPNTAATKDGTGNLLALTDTTQENADGASASGTGKNAPPKVPAKPMRLMTTEKLRLANFLERCGEGRYLLIVRTAHGRLTLAPVLYPQ